MPQVNSQPKPLQLASCTSKLRLVRPPPIPPTHQPPPPAHQEQVSLHIFLPAIGYKTHLGNGQ